LKKQCNDIMSLLPIHDEKRVWPIFRSSFA
jgi:hypothetical protein